MIWRISRVAAKGKPLPKPKRLADRQPGDDASDALQRFFDEFPWYRRLPLEEFSAVPMRLVRADEEVPSA